MEIDFEFRKERKLSEIVQDFINLLRLVLRHFLQTILKLAIVPLCLMLILIYYGTTKINLTTNQAWTESLDMVFLAIAALLALVVVSIVFFGLAIEYFILLKNRRGTDFDAPDVWRAFVTNLGKYFKFLLVSIIAAIVLFIPLVIALIILLFIPFVGSFAAGILGAFVGVWFFCAFLFYREGYMPASNAIQQSFSILKKKVFDYGVSAYVVRLVFQALLVMLTLIPSLIIGIIAYNTIGFEHTFFDSMAGRMFTSIGGTMLVMLYIVYYMFTVLVSGIIYETAKEVTYGEDVYEKIQKLGEEEDGQ